MKQPTKLMKKVLQRCSEWNKDWMGRTEKEGVTWINVGSSRIPLLPGPKVPNEVLELMELVHDDLARAMRTDRISVAK